MHQFPSESEYHQQKLGAASLGILEHHESSFHPPVEYVVCTGVVHGIACSMSEPSLDNSSNKWLSFWKVVALHCCSCSSARTGIGRWSTSRLLCASQGPWCISPSKTSQVEGVRVRRNDHGDAATCTTSTQTPDVTWPRACAPLSLTLTHSGAIGIHHGAEASTHDTTN